MVCVSALLEHTEEFGSAVCDHYNLSQPLSIAQPSLVRPIHIPTYPLYSGSYTPPPPPPHQEVATYIGRVVCDGEGHLNASSCLLEGPVRSRALYSHRVRLEIPEATQCCLFPGQVGRTTRDSIFSPSLSSPSLSPHSLSSHRWWLLKGSTTTVAPSSQMLFMTRY